MSRRYSDEEKLKFVLECFQDGKNATIVANKYQIPYQTLGRWRRQHRDGQLKVSEDTYEEIMMAVNREGRGMNSAAPDGSMGGHHGAPDSARRLSNAMASSKGFGADLEVRIGLFKLQAPRDIPPSLFLEAVAALQGVTARFKDPA